MKFFLVNNVLIINIVQIVTILWPKIKSMIAKCIASGVLIALLGLSSCSKDEDPIEYDPISISGKWHVYAWYNSSLATVENYPNIIDSTVITFSDTGRFTIVGACSNGAGYYLQTQTAEIVVTNFNYPALFCDNLENETQETVYDALEDVYSYKIEDKVLTLRSRRASTPFIYLNKL